MKIRVRVTKSHIDKGERANCIACPIYLSLINRKNKVRVARVGGSMITYWNGIMRSLPLSARSFIANFDNGDPVKPFSFTVEVPDGVCK